MQRTTRGQANWHIGKQTHAKRRQRGNGRSPRDVIPSDGIQAKTVGFIVGTGWIIFVFANTRPTGIGQNGRIDLNPGCQFPVADPLTIEMSHPYRDDVCHGEESRQASTNLRQEMGFAFSRLDRIVSRN